MAKSISLVRLTCGLIALGIVMSFGSTLTDSAQASCLPTPTTGAMKLQADSTKSSQQPGQTQQWRPMTHKEQEMAWESILNSPMGIAALNQLAIERFISPVCRKTFYVNDQTGGFQTLLQVKCPDQQGVSIAMSYDEVRVIFNRFEDSIESFEIKRVYPGQPMTPLPK